MPFKSKAQQKFLYATNPKVAKEMSGKTPKSAYKNMPEHVKKKKGKMSTMLAALKRMGS
jgi:hypothetical protein